MSRTYIQQPDGKVANAKPKRKPKWSSQVPKRDGYYWTRNVHPDDPGIVTNASMCHVSHQDDGTYIMTAGFYAAVGNDVSAAKPLRREFWPVRLKEPPR